MATGRPPRRPPRRIAVRPADWWPPTCNGTSNASCGRCRWSNAATGSIDRPPNDGRPCSGRMWRMALKRDGKRTEKDSYPQLPPAPEDYPTFPDTSTWPVVFPELPAVPGGGPLRPPQHTSKQAAPRIPADQVPKHVAVVMDGNGRWATQRGLGRTEGHKMGEAVLIDVTCGAIELGIKNLSRVCVLHRELESQHRRGPLPHGLQPRGRQAQAGDAQQDGRAHAVGGFAAEDVAQRHQGIRDRRGDDGGQPRHHGQLLRELRRPHRDRRGGQGRSPRMRSRAR